MTAEYTFRPLMRTKQAIPHEECLHILMKEKRGVLSVLGDGGYPYGLPMNHWYCPEDGKLYFHSGLEGHKIDALRRCPKASFCVCDGGWRSEGDWARNFRSVIVFGRIETIEDPERIESICRNLSAKFPADPARIEEEIRRFAHMTLCFALTPEHITGKLVNES